LKNSVF